MPKLRAGSQAAASLLASNSSEEWENALGSYDDSVRRLSQESGRGGLVDIDRWWRTDLPAAICSRKPDPYLTKAELVKIVQWKLWMGVVRPNLLRFATETSPEKVKTKSREAFRHLPKLSVPSGSDSPPETVARVTSTALKKAVTALTSELKGVGPATASAILSAVCGGCPFDADEVIDAVMMNGERKYSLGEYLKVQETLDGKAGRLRSPWDAERVRKALWSRAMHSRFDLSISAPLSDTTAAAAPAPASSGSKTPSKSPRVAGKRGGRGRGGSGSGGKAKKGGKKDGGGGVSATGARGGSSKRQKLNR